MICIVDDGFVPFWIYDGFYRLKKNTFVTILYMMRKWFSYNNIITLNNLNTNQSHAQLPLKHFRLLVETDVMHKTDIQDLTPAKNGVQAR